MRYGFTTGSCAAAAAAAATYMLLGGKEKKEITIETPKGISYTAKILSITREERRVSCAVKKDGGDDPDVTTGALIFADITFLEGENLIRIEGGEGVGRVTKRGLNQPVGSPAINDVPRKMITEEVSKVCSLFDYNGGLRVEISVPSGKELARQTFNPRLGIEGGISILGTSGIVEPMSTKALLDTIRLELNMRREKGYDYVAVSPGNYGLDFMKSKYGYDLDRSVKCSNFIGDTIDMAVELGFKKMLLTGHIGKLIKTAGGIMNTHSKEGDCRMELLAAAAIKCGVEYENTDKILSCISTEEAVRILRECGKLKEVMDYAMERSISYLNRRAGEKMQIDCIMYSNQFGELARSREAEKWFTLLAQEQEQQTL